MTYDPSKEAVERAAKAICEERTWIGAWGRANEVERDSWFRDARAALIAGHEPAPVPDGWHLVPIEPDQAIAAAERRAREAEREEILGIIAKQRAAFSSNEYAGGPLGAFSELFACTQIETSIRARAETDKDGVDA